MATKKDPKKETGTAEPEPKVRVQFDFSTKSLAKLDELVKETNATTRAEVIRRALAIFTACLEAGKRGGSLCFREKGGETREIMLF